MPGSLRRMKPEIIHHIKNTLVDFNSSILDCGPGKGTYSDLLSENNKRIYENMDCCEIHEPYIKRFNLEKKYKNVYISDICDFGFAWYDMIIMGDVLEHIDINRSKKMIEYIYNKCEHLIIVIPFLFKQDACHGNPYEEHLQPDLTHDIFMKRYPGFKQLCCARRLAAYIKE